MHAKAAITINRPAEEVERLWHSSPHGQPGVGDDAQVSFTPAPGDRGTEIHVSLTQESKLGDTVAKLSGAAPLAKLKDELRHFKAQVETGEVPRSDSTPEGEKV